MRLEQQQITELAKPFVTMLDSIIAFYENADNKKAYEEWYKSKYGSSPESEVKV